MANLLGLLLDQVGVIVDVTCELRIASNLAENRFHYPGTQEFAISPEVGPIFGFELPTQT